MTRVVSHTAGLARHKTKQPATTTFAEKLQSWLSFTAEIL